MATTPTRTVYIMRAGTVQFNVTFLSPVEASNDLYRAPKIRNDHETQPDNLVLQSFPFGYVFIEVASDDGAAPEVQIYSDLSGEWLSSSSKVGIQWNTSLIPSPLIAHAVKLSSSKELNESEDTAQDAILRYATNQGNGVTWDIGGAHEVRPRFFSQGFLNDTQNLTYRYIDEHFIEQERALCQSSTVLDYKVQLSGKSADADNAKVRALKLDERIQTEARGISPSYKDLVSLATRQMLAGVETVVELSTDSIYMFMKDIGSSSRVSAMETLYATFPAFLYINATWCQYLLEDSGENQTLMNQLVS
ncbi:hypothetical protein PM082_022017 [Marasmius tenuissimus]|nr:hypothetical protein PM082_022017 [Marasmius tenuissimus]